MDIDNIQAVIDTAVKGVPPTVLHDAPGVKWITTPNRGVEKVDTSATLPAPVRKSGIVTVFDAASFNQIIADNSDAGNIAIYLDRDVKCPAVVGVLNGNGKGGPGWGDFRVKIAFRKTPQWVKWEGIDGKMLPQAGFAEFVEDNLSDVADPSGALLLEIVTYLQATRTVDFKSALRLSSGAIQFQNLESVDAKVGAGLIAVPETFTLGLSPFLGCPSYAIPARFRYRLQEGKLTLGIRLQRVEDMMTKIIDDVVAKIERGTNISMVDGLAP